MTTQQRRRVVTHLRAAYSVSARRAMRLIGLSRSRWHYRPQRPLREAPVRERLKALATHREERVLVRPHRSRKRTTEPRVPLPAPMQPNERWGMDFIYDACVSGRRFRCLTMVDEFTRECPRIDVDTSLPAARVIAALEQLAAVRGLAKSLVVDNGPEFIARAPSVDGTLWTGAAPVTLTPLRNRTVGRNPEDEVPSLDFAHRVRAVFTAQQLRPPTIRSLQRNAISWSRARSGSE